MGPSMVMAGRPSVSGFLDLLIPGMPMSWAVTDVGLRPAGAEAGEAHTSLSNQVVFDHTSQIEREVLRTRATHLILNPGGSRSAQLIAKDWYGRKAEAKIAVARE